MSNDTSKEKPERRRRDRFPARELGWPVDLQPLVPGRQPCRGELVNVSVGGLALWLPTELEARSHWLLLPAGVKSAPLPAKVVHVKSAFGGYVHAFRFALEQESLANKLSGASPRRSGTHGQETR